jgi:hypothetical protein
MKTIPALLIAVIAVALVCGCVGEKAPTVPTVPPTPEVSAADDLSVQDLGGVADNETLGHGLEDEAVF